jgi:catechol 2,3-dioxygenase-like lactoylglutathione lyase family enzyme
VIRLDHTHIFASHLEATVHFYRTMFGARVVYDTRLVGRRNVRLDIGGTALHLYDQAPRSADRGLIHHLGIRTDDLDGHIVHMRANGVVFRKEITEDQHFRYITCEAQDGVLLELYEVKAGAEWMVV